MKKIILLICVIIIKTNTYSQVKTDEANYKWNINVQVSTIDNLQQYDKALLDEYNYSSDKYEFKTNSYSGGIGGNYLLTESTFLSCMTGITKVNIIQNSDTRTNSLVPGSNYSVGNFQITQATSSSSRSRRTRTSSARAPFTGRGR